MDSIKNLDLRIQKIEHRNKSVEATKAWENSLLRRLVISLLTYLIIGFYFNFVLQITNPWLNALVPTIAFLLSTLSLELIKNLWIKYLYKK